MLLEVNQTLDKKGITDSLKYVYNELYKNHDYHPTNSLGSWSIISRLFKFKEALDVGCGIGYGIADGRSKFMRIYGCDIANLRDYWKKLGINEYCEVAPAHHLPYKTGRFDLVVCCDVLEHIPEKLVDDTLREINRVGSRQFFFHICSAIEKSKNNPRDKGICESHITIKPDDWWLDRMALNGFTVLGVKKYPDEPHLLSLTAVKESCKDDYFIVEKNLEVMGSHHQFVNKVTL